MKTNCDKNIHRQRTNNFGVTWCTECGRLFKGNVDVQPLDKNFLVKPKGK
jgi:hypothetical protein